MSDHAVPYHPPDTPPASWNADEVEQYLAYLATLARP